MFKLALCIALLASLACATQVFDGFATINVDLTGFGNRVSVALCANTGGSVRNDQGGVVQSYNDVNTVNGGRSCDVTIQEGSLTYTQNFVIVNGGTYTVTGHRAQLAIHLENYDPYCFSGPGGTPNSFEIDLQYFDKSFEY